MGRPTSYTPEAADRICQAIIEGEESGALYKICGREGYPSETSVYKWLDEHPEFAEKYARARELQQDREADNIVVIADDAKDANLARLQIDARKWRASKLAPKKYGDRLDLNHSGSIQNLSDDQLNDRLAQLLGKGGVGVVARGDGAEEG